MEVNTDLKPLEISIFLDLKKPLNWLRKIEENLSETANDHLEENVYKLLTINFLYYLLLGLFTIETSVLGGNVN